MKPKYKVDERVGFSEISKNAAKKDQWAVNAKQSVNRGWAIIEKIDIDTDVIGIGISYSLQGSSYLWYENELEKIKINILPDELFEL